MTDAGPSVSVERLRLRATGLDEGAARVLARLVAEKLAGDLHLSPGRASIASLTIDVPGKTRERPEATAERIAAAIRQRVAIETGGSGQ
jgi:hypothetical protein